MRKLTITNTHGFTAESLLKEDEMMIQNSSQPGELVVDFFTGIGASMEAAFNLKRDFYGFEIDTGYYNDILKRYDRIHT